MSQAAAAKMDSIYRFQRHVYDATRAYYLLGRDQLISELDVVGSERVLEVACGTGRNLIRAAQAYRAAQFYGFDISDQMLATAERAISKCGLCERIKIANGDATRFDPERKFGVRSFDRIFISFALSMIPDWRAAVDDAVSHLAPGGRLLIVDFGTLERYPKPFQAVQNVWLKQFSVTPIVNLKNELAALGARSACDVVSRELFGGYSVITTFKHANHASLRAAE